MKELSAFYHYKDGYDLSLFVIFMLSVIAVGIFIGMKEDK